MKTNWNVSLIGDKVMLVPYRQVHVPRYHEWMSNADLLALTGSEPLTLDEEFQMQKTWRDSEDKCTFIVLSKETFERGDKTSPDELEVQSMVGDTNLFLSEDTQDDEKVVKVAEVEIMIADCNARRKGFGREAISMMLRYGFEELDTDLFQAKIKIGNDASIRLFEDLGFKEIGRSDVFQEIVMEAEVKDTWKEKIFFHTKNFIKKHYHHFT